MIPEITLAVTGLGSRMVSLRVKKITESITNVVAPTIANLINSWCRSAKGRIARGSRAIVASAKDTTAKSRRIRRALRRGAGHRGDTAVVAA